jgi:hypothetical protein
MTCLLYVFSARRTFRPEFGILPTFSVGDFIPTDIKLRNSRDRMALNNESDRREHRVSTEEAKDIILPKMPL